jgi:protoporphyrinogen oxidase
VDEQGFTWDVGGHVQFSHYQYFDDLMDRLLPNDWLWHERESWIWMQNTFIPYPFQNNIRHLPPDVMRECLRGLIQAASHRTAAPANFAEWIRSNFGEGIARHFMLPYNFKVWAYPPEEMDFQWVGERVAQVDLERIVFNVLDGRDDISWGPNNRFRFPRRGGTGEIWRRLAASMPGDHIRYNAGVEYLDSSRKRLRLTDGSSEPYDILISTMPLDMLVRNSDLTEYKTWVDLLRYSTVYVIGIGLKGEPPPSLRPKCWMYFPETNSPFYRATVFSNYSPHNVPNVSPHWSLMVEVAESPCKPVERDRLIDEVISALLENRLVDSPSHIVSLWQYSAGHGYPTPYRRRDDVINSVLPGLESHNVYSRGRFGAWKYEVSNQDHSLMQGVELIDHLALGAPEVTLLRPDEVNHAKR